MRKICEHCHIEFNADHSSQKYCSHKCATDAANIIRSSDYNDILKYYDEHIDSGMTYKEIANNLGYSVSKVRNVCSKNGRKKPLTKLQATVKKYRGDGLCSSEISSIMGINAKHIRAIANAIDMPFTNEEKCKSEKLARTKMAETLKQRGFERYIGRIPKDWEYDGEYTGENGYIKLKHICGKSANKSSVTVRQHANLVCPYCVDVERTKKENAKKSERLKAEMLKNADKKYDNYKFQVCCVCNSVFIGRKKYCSARCSNKVINSKNKDKRLRKLKSNDFDGSISLKKLSIRDNDICYICNKKVNWDDCIMRDNVFIAGNYYPSIEHVVPISQGGVHKWENVKLAHRICNSYKGDKVGV